MGSEPRGRQRRPLHRRWLALSFLGIWVYLGAQLLQLNPSSFAEGAALTLADAHLALRIMSNLGQVLLFTGIVAVLWRANRAIGLSGIGLRGVVAGAVGTGVLAVLETALVSQWFRLDFGYAQPFADLYPVVSVLGVALALAGIASLAVGLTRATRPIEHPTEAPSVSSGGGKPV